MKKSSEAMAILAAPSSSSNPVILKGIGDDLVVLPGHHPAHHFLLATGERLKALADLGNFHALKARLEVDADRRAD